VPSSPGIAHNYHLSDRLVALKNVLNTGHVLRLFKNNVVPDPSYTIAAFIESTFPGYAAVPLTGDFGDPVQVANGQFQISGTSHQFSFTSGTVETAYGWYLTSTADNNVRFSFLFASPVFFTNGVVVYVQPIIQDWAYSVVP
jgi:hypothetical protein